jgi:hypothetical protein
MGEHVKVLGVIGAVRALLGAALATLLLAKAATLVRTDYPDALYSPEVLTFDRIAFTALGGLAAVLAVLRCVQAAGIFLRARWAKQQGLALAVFDIANLLLFPVSTALGLYGVVVYRNPGSAGWFAGRRRAP